MRMYICSICQVVLFNPRNLTWPSKFPSYAGLGQFTSRGGGKTSHYTFLAPLTREKPTMQNGCWYLPAMSNSRSGLPHIFLECCYLFLGQFVRFLDMNDDFLKPLDVNFTVGTGTDNLNSKYSVLTQTLRSELKYLSSLEDKFEFATKFSSAPGRILYAWEYYTLNSKFIGGKGRGSD